MTDELDILEMKRRLAEKLAESGITMRSASVNAGFGKGYVQNLLTSDGAPMIAKLATICEKNDISLSYVLFGLEMSPQTKRLLQLIEKHPEKLDSLLVLLGE